MHEHIDGATLGRALREFLRRPTPALVVAVVVAVQCGTSSAASHSQGSKASAANGGCRQEDRSGRASVVEALYMAYPAGGDKVPQNEPIGVLLKYFDDRLAHLLVKDHECRQRTQELCAITFSIIYAAQDMDIKDLKVCGPAPRSDLVEVRFLNFGKLTTLSFDVKRTPRGWRIADVRYEGGGSLVDMLVEGLTTSN